jgi:hypothetical protein
MMLTGFMNANRENHGHVTAEDYNLLIDKWKEYDINATGWIDPQDIAFLMYEVPKPLGRSEEYADIMKRSFEILEDTTLNQRVLPNQTRFVVKFEKNMVLPTSLTIQAMKLLAVPIYLDEGENKCHFRDVCLGLTKLALKRAGQEAPFLDEILVDEWAAAYEELDKKVKMKDEDSGSYLAGLFIARMLKSVQERRSRNKKETIESISVVNRKAEYSAKLRDIEKQRHLEEE